MTNRDAAAAPSGLEIAVVGMAGRFPGAAGVDELWANVAAGVESIRRFGDDELAAAGVPAELRAQPGYVPAGGVLDGIEEMDARFFGYGPREAEILDPQHRLFLEWSWQALEDAGIDPRRFARPVGVWGGTDVNTYLLFHLMGNPELVRLVGAQQLRHANRPDTLTTRVAYALDLTGPAVTVQTTCSTGLVAVHLACQSLLNGECDLALAGGVSVDVGQRGGYLAREGGILSPDGHVRAFDADAAGMVSGNGGGVVALARLEDALDEGHRVLAVIKGSAINNDGARKVSYSAPGLEGQARVVRAAQVVAGVEPDSIGYVEAHGTGTRLGDPIEVAALTRAFRAGTDRRGFCALGSVKTNIGHLDAGAGVAGLIKAVQALRHRRIPPSLHFRRPNPEIDLAASPFYVAAEGAAWPADGGPRRAGVSSLGIGGTNAHVVLEEAPPPPPPAPSRPRQLLVVSARSAAALGAALTRLGDHLRGPAGPPLADASWTLATGRRAFAHRAALVAADAAEAARVARGEDEAAARRIAGQAPEEGVREVAFLLPGQGAQHPGMGAGLYRHEAVFRAEIDRAAEALRPHLDGLDLRRLLFPDAGDEEAAAAELARTRFTQPALFAVEHALARQWASWGVEPAAMLGHSLGEYVAACLAGVFSLPDALALVAARGRMMEALPPGSMLSVPLAEEELAPHLGDELALAAVNAPGLATVSGPPAAVESLAARLEAEGVEVRRLHTSHAFHSAMMDPILDAFAERVSRVALAAPQRPYLSNLTGTWATAAEATDPAAWARHLRSTVRFGHGAAELLASGDRVLLEVGPGRTLASLVRRQARPDSSPGGGRPRVVVSMRHPTEEGDDQEALLGALGRLWCAGVAVDWDGYFAAESRRRVGLPTYPFERRRYWVEAPGRAAAGAAAAADLGERAEPAAMSLHERPDLSTVYAEPRSEVERAVAGIWERLLGVGGVGAFDDFFELGGHSLLATQVLSRVRDAFQVELPLKAFFDAPSVAGLAATVDAARAAAGAAGALDVPPPLVPVERSGDLPLSFAQQRLWFLSRLEPGGDAYNVPVAVRLSGDLDVEGLERTFAAIVARHEVLRTRFAERDGEPLQVVSPPPAGPAPLPRVDLSGLPEDERRAAVERHARAEARRPFDLAAGPLLRVTLLAEARREHVALVVMHHIVTDGWSMGLLVREIGELYTAFVTGRDPVLPALPVQYADYAAWQRRWLAGEVLERKVAWWRETLGEDPPPAALPVDRPRTAARTWAGGSVGFTFTPETAERLARFGRESGATAFMTLLAAWAGLLSRVTGQEDVRVGTPVAGRNRSEVESLIGFFVNTLVLRTDLSGGPSFAALVARVREASLAANEHQDVPFERLVEELVRDRSLAVTPLFQVFFVLQNAPGGRLELPELTLAALPAESRSAKFDLSLQVEERTRGLTATLEYAADLFDAGTAERMAGHLQRLLEAALAEPDRPLAELPLATAAERRQLVAGWNDTAAPVPPGSLHALVERRAAAAPEAPAVVAGDVTWSYADLDRRAAAVAARLAAAGVGREDRVALVAERSPEALAGLLGTLKAGAAFVAVDPGTPAERLAFLLADSAAAAVLAGERLRPRVEGLGVPVVGLEDLDAAAEPRSAHPRRGDAVPAEAAAWVVYTSGSTGVPKGVVVPHGAAVNHTAAVAARYRLVAADRVLHFASLAFDAALEELFPTWHAGAAVVLRSDEAALDLRVLERQVEREGVTVLNLPTAYWHEWAAELDAAGTAPPAGVRLVVVGTEAALPERLAAWRRRAGEVEWINAYGPSEATVTATVWPAAWEARTSGRGDAADGAPVPVRMPIGRPLANVRAHVVDPALAPVPVGLPGELLLGGGGLARGYLGRPGLTAERFVPDPFAAELANPPGGRLYRTGDRVRRLPDGDLEFLGRLDQQVKLRGFRIEPGEVEAALAELPEVREAAVVVDEPAPGDRRLVACLVAAGAEADAGAEAGREARTGAVREALARRLPPPMVPAAFAWLDRLPRTAGGKVDRRALGAVAAEAAGTRRRAEPVPPTNALETKLVAIWREVLGGGEIGVHDNFFEIGGHSLKATQLVARVRRDLGVDLPLRQVFERPTVAGLAAAVEAADAAPARDAAAIRDALARLDQLSDEEARALLAEMAAAGEP